MKQTWKNYLLYGSGIFIVMLLIIDGYSETWTGFGDYILPNGDFVRGKTLWDWLELLVIPLVLGVGAFFLNHSERNSEREIATDRQKEATLQAYLDRIAELVLKEKLLESGNEKALNVARVRTLTVLRGLNAARNTIVVRFLRDMGLAGNVKSNFFVNASLEHVDLQGVDLRNTNLEGAILVGANLERANLVGANLLGANLERANLVGTNLVGANLKRANLEGTNLVGANLLSVNLERANLVGASLEGAYLKGVNLQGAIVYRAQWILAKSLKGAIMPDGTKYD